MSPRLFTSAILEGRPIDVSNMVKMQRDSTLVEDIAEGTIRVLDHIPTGNPPFSTGVPDPGSSFAPCKVYNIRNHQPVELMAFIKTIEDALAQEAKKNFIPMQPGDIVATCPNVEDLKRYIGFKPKIPLADSIACWAALYKTYAGR